MANGDRVDVHLKSEKYSIACEISVTNKVDYEVGNIQKCLAANYDYVLCLSQNRKHLHKIQTKAEEIIDTEKLKKVFFLDPQYLPEQLDSLMVEQPKEKTVRGYRVKVARPD